MQELHLSNTLITDEALAHLTANKDLHFLHVSHTKVTEAGLATATTVVVASVTGQRDQEHVLGVRLFPELPSNFMATHTRHFDVDQQDPRHKRLCGFQSG